MQFFVPDVPDDEATATFEGMRDACGASDDTRPSYSIPYEDEGSEVVATVGEKGVVAIIAGEASTCPVLSRRRRPTYPMPALRGAEMDSDALRRPGPR